MERKPPSIILFPTQPEKVRDTERGPRKSRKRSKKGGESILERFDKMVNAKLEERRVHDAASDGSSADEATSPETGAPGTQRPLRSISKTLASSMSNIDVLEQMNLNQDDELAEAVEKLIKAEETARFTEMIVAAEAAVAAAPPELAEEAALAVAQDYQTQTVSAIKEEIPGDTVIEIVGYIGIRRRKRRTGISCAC
ncbi:uncharacterized protein LOC112495017 [Cephus cinctus]|uniref:Uncharacterized protein LOC112495017 n=1 Tax=Cephus cinctus TaxID=211228 RepID=A0AAJ7RRK2_CEPCN|nr:uncharacterized protein LOC112495017 [Cephus cinctus]